MSNASSPGAIVPLPPLKVNGTDPRSSSGSASNSSKLMPSTSCPISRWAGPLSSASMRMSTKPLGTCGGISRTCPPAAKVTSGRSLALLPAPASSSSHPVATSSTPANSTAPTARAVVAFRACVVPFQRGPLSIRVRGATTIRSQYGCTCLLLVPCVGRTVGKTGPRRDAHGDASPSLRFVLRSPATGSNRSTMTPPRRDAATSRPGRSTSPYSVQSPARVLIDVDRRHSTSTFRSRALVTNPNESPVSGSAQASCPPAPA